jgi:hypothetical protein
MAAASQGGDEEECRALELELAAELAALSAQDVGLDGDCQRDDSACWTSDGREAETGYVRLDLEAVLLQLSAHAALSHDGSTGHTLGGKTAEPTSWDLLLESVERTDREFFQPCHENLKDIRASILERTFVSAARSGQPQPKATDAIEQQPCALGDEEDPPGLELARSQSDPFVPAALLDEKDEQAASSDPVAQRSDGCNKAEDVEVVVPSSVGIAERSLACDPSVSVLTPPGASVVPPSLRNESLLPGLPEEFSSADDHAVQKAFERIAKQHEAREARRQKTQARRQKEREEADCLLQQLQDELEAQEKYMETTRREARESSLMANEELRCRQYTAAQREAHEATCMALADEASRQFATELARLQDAVRSELALMAVEDQAERLRMKAERENQHQQRVALVRGCRSAVLLELTKLHQAQRHMRAQQAKRERRECVQMRAEEAYSRRILAETRAFLELRERGRARALMVLEDGLSSTREDHERLQKLQAHERQRQEDCRGRMAQEERRTRCAWERLAEQAAKAREKQRLQVLTHLSTGLPQLGQVLRRHELAQCLDKWRRWSEQDRARSETADSAAKRIQMWHRSCRQRLQHVTEEPPLLLEDFSDDEAQPQVEAFDATSRAAALCVQSTFRGFHVRRKFANALALAQAVGGREEGDCFDAVDLDDLIQLPPELVDGWEDPVLPPVAVRTPQRQYPPRVDQEEEEDRPELVESNEAGESVPQTKVSTPPAPARPPKEQNLAATLWGKMKRAKQRQQHAQQERQRQQDPAYRVQKLLHRKPNARQNGPSNNQSSHSRTPTPQGGQKAANMISWSSTGSAKKKPKVKLPSLVERLRRQTLAER